MTVINLEVNSNHEKCEAIRKLGYDIERSGKGCVLTSKKYKNLDQYIDVYYRNVNEVLLTFRQELNVAGYNVVRA